MDSKAEIEYKRDRLNLDIRGLLAVIDIIDGVDHKYDDYVTNTLNEQEFLDQQIRLVNEAKNRLINIFRN